MKSSNIFLNLLNSLRNKEVKIGIIGMGYVGLPLAIAYAEKGFKVLGIDIDKSKVEKIMSIYSDYCNDFLSIANLTIGSKEFIDQISNMYPDIKFFILSGAEKNEISRFLKSKKIYSKFQALLCSEKSKYEHLKSFELCENDFFIGDSKNDLKISKLFPLRFILVTDFGSDCSIPHKDEVDDNIIITKNLSKLLL